MYGLVFFDSDDPAQRRKVLRLQLSRPDAQRGTLWEGERESPADVWPSLRLIGKGYSITTARKDARRRGLVEAQL